MGSEYQLGFRNPYHRQQLTQIQQVFIEPKMVRFLFCFVLLLLYFNNHAFLTTKPIPSLES